MANGAGCACKMYQAVCCALVYLTPSLATLGSPPQPTRREGAARRVSAEWG